MRIAVVTPVYQAPPRWLEQCLASVHRQSVPCTHFVVNDGDESLRAADLPGVEFILLPHPHRDRGNNARAVGSLLAISGHFDAIGYLDTNSWFEVDHLEQMVLLHERTGAAVCTAARNLVDGEGRLLRRCLEVDGENYVATSCLFLTRGGVRAGAALVPHAAAAEPGVRARYMGGRDKQQLCTRPSERADGQLAVLSTGYDSVAHKPDAQARGASSSPRLRVGLVSHPHFMFGNSFQGHGCFGERRPLYR